MVKLQRVALVTGATGFIGSNLARRLVRDGWEVHTLSRAGSRFPDAPEFVKIIKHFTDGSTKEIVHCVAQIKPDVVFHLASQVMSAHTTEDVGSLIVSNVLFGNQLLEAMKVNKVTKIVNTGTFWQHYNNEDYNPVCLYAATKQAFEAILEYYVQAYFFEAITLKLFDNYGPDDPRPKLFQLLNKAATSGKPLDMSAGEQLIDLVHIDDVIEAYVIAAEHLLGGVVSHHEYYAVSSGHPILLKELVQIYAEVTCKAVVINWGVREYRNREVMIPWNSGVALPQWKPKVSLFEGFSKINHANNNKNISI